MSYICIVSVLNTYVGYDSLIPVIVFPWSFNRFIKELMKTGSPLSILYPEFLALLAYTSVNA
jgi:hypothetical protein